MEMNREQQVSASPTASGSSPLEIPRGSQTPPVPWESSGEKSRSLEEEARGRISPIPISRGIAISAAGRPLLPCGVQGMESSSPRAGIPQGEMRYSTLGKKNTKGDTEGKEAGNERIETLYQPYVERGGKNPQKSVDKSGGFWDLG